MAALDGQVHVVISHNHYDHLDVDTLRALPDQARVYVPLGLQKYVEKFHDGMVMELDWWHSITEEGVILTCLPSQHWTRRIGQGNQQDIVGKLHDPVW